MALTKLDRVYLLGPTTPVTHKVSCDICGGEDLTKYIYGALRNSRTWAELCIPCYVQHGTNVGGRWKGKVYGWNNVSNIYETNNALTERFMLLLHEINAPYIVDLPTNIKRDLCDIAIDVEQSWSNIHYDAVPYLEAMFNIRTMSDTYDGVSAISIVRSFLMYANADRWRGTNARRIRLELKRKLKGR